MNKVRADTLQIGNVIMPPPREVQLWMRRELQRRNLPESALYLTITAIEEGMPDKTGRWLGVCCDRSAEWEVGMKPYPFRFKVRPETLWQKVEPVT